MMAYSAGPGRGTNRGEMLLLRAWTVASLITLGWALAPPVSAKPAKPKRPTAAPSKPSKPSKPPTKPSPAPTPTAPPASKASDTQIVHQPPDEQGTMTALPVAVEITGSEPDKVEVKYEGFGSKGWTALPLEHLDSGWGAEIPCQDVGTVIGVLRYYVVAYDADGREIATSGSSKKPYKVKIRRGAKSESHLPGRPPPTKCKDTTDCPPDFPGCVATAGEGDGCISDDDCDKGRVCTERKCKAPAAATKDNLFSLVATGEVAFIRDSDYCAAPHQVAGDYWCVRDDGDRYSGTPLADIRATSSYGLAVARVVLGYDRFIATHIALGLRAGVTVWGQAPALEGRARSLPINAELRLGYWFTRDTTLRPFFFLAGGYAPADYRFKVLVDEDTSVPPEQAGNPPEQVLTAYRRLGPFFGGLGLGTMIALSSSIGILAGVEGRMTFPARAYAVAPELGMAFGF
jgi:hypothetical protein